MAIRVASGVPTAVDTCVIRWWRGYRSSTFYAADEDGTVLGESPPFRWRKAETPPGTDAARDAHDALVAALEDAGWTCDGFDGAWFETRLTRPSTRARVRVEPKPAPVVVAEPEPLPEPEPVVVVAPRPQPPVLVEAPAAPREPRRTRRLRLFSALFALVGVVVFGYVALAPGKTHVVTTRVQQPKPHVQRATHTAATPVAAAPSRVARVRIAAGDRGSWLEIRSGSPTGRVLFSGTLEPGKALAFRAPRLWARFGAAGNLTITQNGRPVRLMGTYEHVFRG